MNLVKALAAFLIAYIACVDVSWAQTGSPPSRTSVEISNHIENLDSSDPVKRARSASQLGEMGEKAASAVPFLIKLLGDGAPLQWQRLSPVEIEGTSPGREAEKALVKIGKPAVEQLIAALSGPNRITAATILAKLDAVEALIAALKHDDAQTRNSAAYALAAVKLEDKRIVEPLITALADSDSQVRHNAATALRKITGENFGEAATKWREWWNRNRPRE